jgi:hypothetical protein
MRKIELTFPGITGLSKNIVELKQDIAIGLPSLTSRFVRVVVVDQPSSPELYCIKRKFPSSPW